VAVVQYTNTHKQYREQHKTNNTWNNTKIRKSAGPCPVFAGFTLAFALRLRKKDGKISALFENGQSSGKGNRAKEGKITL